MSQVSTQTSAAPVTTSRRKSSISSLQLIQQGSVVLLTIILVIYSWMKSGGSAIWADDLLTYAAPIGIVACGMTFVMVAGGFDLSVASITAVCGVVFVLMLRQLETQSAAVAVPIALACTLIAGVILGAINGGLIAYIGVNPFVTTLSTLFIFRGVALFLTDGGQSFLVPIEMKPAVRAFYWGGLEIPGTAFRLSTPLLTLIVLFVVGLYGLRFTRFGHYCYALGGNERAAWLSGINTAAVKASTYVISGVTCAVAAVLLIGLSVTAEASSHKGLEMIVIAAVIVGGTPLGGGRGGLWNTMVGLILLCVIQKLLTQWGAPDEYQQIVTGAIIVTVVAIDVLIRRTKNA